MAPNCARHGPPRRCALLFGAYIVACHGAPALLAVRLANQAPDTTGLGRLLTAAADYARRFERSMSTVVIEERYVQVIKPWTFPPREPDIAHLSWLEDLSAWQPDVVVTHRRQTRSDLLLVQLPDQRWTAFRDTFEVNGRALGHREDRLRDLFLRRTEDSRQQLRRINERSADWNLGGFYREVNLPTIGMLVVHPSNQARFVFLPGQVARGTGDCRSVSFRETARPTLVRSLRERNVPLSGEICIDDEGLIWQSRVHLDPRYTTRGLIDVTYRREDGLDVLVPHRMWEWYALPEPDARGLPLFVEGLATYSNLRRFTVTTTEQIK